MGSFEHSKTLPRIAQLKAITIGQVEEDGDPTLAVLRSAEAAIEALEGVALQQEPPVQDDAVVDILETFHRDLQAVDVETEAAWEKKFMAEMDLKELEQSILEQWREKKLASEHWTRRHAALTGVGHAMRVTQQRYEFSKHLARAAEGGGTVDDTLTQSTKELEFYLADEGAWNDRESQEDDDLSFNTMHSLSDVLVQGTSTKDREDILRREHPGSADHPHGCRACHFQGGLCWKGFACSFCHICPKPKRKSKHQRDVDKRRQERYRQVKDDLGPECLDELNKIDDARRQMMITSEGLKKRVKEAYASGDMMEIHKTKSDVSNLQLPGTVA